MVNKRKRGESSDSDSEEINPGKQILPVANLPHDFDQEPQDGMQYLFLVRRDARRLPHVTRVRNPYEVPETKVAGALTTPAADGLPCEQWRVMFQTHFFNLRKNLTQATIHGEHDDSCPRRRAIPEKKDRDAWWKYLAGYPGPVWYPKDRSVRKKLGMSVRTQASVEPGAVTHFVDAMGFCDVQSEDEHSRLWITCPCDLPRDVSRRSSALDFDRSVESQSAAPFAIDPSLSDEVQKEHTEQLSPPEVTPAHLRNIDHRTSMHLLMYFTHWINVHLQNPSDPLVTITINHARWIFALLTKVEDQLSADEMNLLRNLARACLGIIQRYRNDHVKKGTMLEGDSVPVPVESRAQASDVSCWMVFAAITGYWGQRDLWTDAAATLGSA